MPIVTFEPSFVFASFVLPILIYLFYYSYLGSDCVKFRYVLAFSIIFSGISLYCFLNQNQELAKIQEGNSIYDEFIKDNPARVVEYSEGKVTLDAFMVEAESYSVDKKRVADGSKLVLRDIANRLQEEN